jgi:hypothetical protein
MDRRALIIANPGTQGEESYCHGVSRDVDNYKAFLKSPVGGFWSEDEIVVRHKPSHATIISDIGQQKRADYSLTVFCGHGYHTARTNSTIVELKQGTDIDADELRAGANKHTLILDCCRVIHTAVYAEDAAPQILKKAVSKISASECRKFYDKAIADCPTGIVVLFGCSINETAGDSDTQGGFYSYSLISAAEAWSRETDVDTSEKYRPLSVVKAHEMAAQGVARMSGSRQTPAIDKPRSGNYFPFCIIA